MPAQINLAIGHLRALVLVLAGSVFPLLLSTPEGRSDDAVSRDEIDRETLCAVGRGRRCNIEFAIDRGLFETGLQPKFPAAFDCRGIDEAWAISYTHKRDRENYHGGIDMPAPFGTPIIAVAAGTVVAKYDGARSYRGIEIILRHSPDDTGMPLWIYTQYAHFDEMPKLKIGQDVGMGEVLGPTGNSGIAPSRRRSGKERRPAIHFAVWFSKNPHYYAGPKKVIPADGFWMDPIAIYRMAPPFDSFSLKALSDAAKNVPIPVMTEGGTTIPRQTKLVWPYRCAKD